MKIGIILLSIAIIYIIVCYNKFVRLRNKCEESDSGIDVALAKRYAVLQNMVETCKAYMKHEQDTLSMVVKLRSHMSIEEKEQANDRMNQMDAKIKLVAEQYPNLKADGLFINLQHTLVDVEEHLQAARRAYNANVSMLNQKVEMFPSNLIAFVLRFKKREFFTANETEKESPVMQF